MMLKAYAARYPSASWLSDCEGIWVTLPSRSLETYLQAAQRENNQRSYTSAVRHFEVISGGLLPATADRVSQYLVAYAATLSINTLRQQLSALSHWHQAQGFSDPTIVAVVKNARGHPSTPSHA